jgi:hypothetical protein
MPNTKDIPLTVSWFPTAMPNAPAAIGDPERTTWGQFCDVFWSRREGEKDGPNFVPARLSLEADGRHVRRLKTNLLARTAIALDCETDKKTGEVPPDFSEVVERIKIHRLAAVVYTSHSHTAAAPRYRIVLPLSEEIATVLPAPEVVADQLQLLGVLDRSKIGAASLFYLPSCPPDQSDRHNTRVIEGNPIDAAWLRERGGILLAQRQAEADHISQQAHAEAAARRAAGFDPDDSLIEKIRMHLDLNSILCAHGYATTGGKNGQRYRHPNSESGSYGADIKVLGGIERVFSHNGTDPLHKSNLPDWCSVAAVDAFDVVCILDFGGNRERALKELGAQFNITKATERKTLAKLLFQLIRDQAPQETIETEALAAGDRLGLTPPQVCEVARWVIAKATTGEGGVIMHAGGFPDFGPAKQQSRQIISLDDFFAYMPMHNYIYAPTRSHWPGTSVNARLPAVQLTDASGQTKTVKPAAWLDKHKPVEQMTWAPGLPMVVRDKLILEGGWIDHHGATVFNLYRPPENLRGGDHTSATKWLDHIKYIYPDEADHITKWLAQRIQRPQDKVNHALVLGGPQGIGKDTLLEPVKYAIGHWNFQETSPQQILGRFNGFLRSVILRISEARDLGDFDRFSFYDHMKAYTAAPPDTLRVDEKHLREYNILNCCGVIITTNHKNDGIFLSPDDRRHYVAWSPREKEDAKFQGNYWKDLWTYYQEGGLTHVAAFLQQLDISDFDPKAPPPKTAVFWSIVDANRAGEEAELADTIEKLGNPNALLLQQLRIGTDHSGLAEWLADRKNRRTIPYRMEQCGYVAVRNDAASDGLWKVNSRRQAVYAKASLGLRDQVKAAAEIMAAAGRPGQSSQ